MTRLRPWDTLIQSTFAKNTFNCCELICMNLRRCLFLLAFCFACVAITIHSHATSEAPVTTIKSKVRVVLVDAVVTDDKGNPVHGLRSEDFELREDGKPQKIASFEEHRGAPLTLSQLPALAPHVYTNLPVAQAADSINVILLDALNTQMRDQVEVHRQMLAYLKTIPLGTRVAIFTLASRLELLQTVATDSSELLDLLNNKNGAAGPKPSQILPSEVETEANEHMINFMIEANADPSAIDAVTQFQADNATFQTDARVRITLEALQQIARYFSAVPGRKNVIWFSGSFPISIMPDADLPDQLNASQSYKEEIQKTADLLASDDVAIYPIAAEGLQADAHYEVNGAPVEAKRFSGVIAEQNQHLQRGGLQRYSNQVTMEALAQATGGRAFYNTNGLRDALAKVVNDGSQYYSISYTPTDTKMNGKFRHIQLKLRDKGYKLSYRRGYYAAPAKDVAGTQSADADPLLPLMGRNMPAYSQIVYKIRVLRANPQPLPDAPVVGGNSALKRPFTRYSVDFAIPAKYLKLTPTPDGGCTGGIEVMLIAYDRLGKTLNFIGTTNKMVLTPSVYAQVIRGGLQLHREIDVPNGEVFLQTGVYDLAANTAGTLAVSMRENPTLASAGQKTGSNPK